MSASRLTLLSVTLLLLCAITFSTGLRMSSGPKKCCFDFAERQIPLKRVSSYKLTSPQCTNQAVLFRTVAGRQVCARPSDSWVQNYMTYLDKKDSSKLL